MPNGRASRLPEGEPANVCAPDLPGSATTLGAEPLASRRRLTRRRGSRAGQSAHARWSGPTSSSWAEHPRSSGAVDIGTWKRHDSRPGQHPGRPRPDRAPGLGGRNGLTDVGPDRRSDLVPDDAQDVEDQVEGGADSRLVDADHTRHETGSRSLT